MSFLCLATTAAPYHIHGAGLPSLGPGPVRSGRARWDHEPFDIPLVELRWMSDAEHRKYVRTATLREAELSSPPVHSSKIR